MSKLRALVASIVAWLTTPPPVVYTVPVSTPRLFSAAEARKLVHDYRVQTMSLDLSIVLDYIKYMAIEGGKEAVVDRSMSEADYILLEDQGFTVSRARENRPTTIIRW